MASINFCVIPKAESAALCIELNLQQGILYSEYRSKPLIHIDNTCPPNVVGNVYGDGNCLYRAICLEISGSEISYKQIKQLTVFELTRNRHNFVYIDKDLVQDLIDSAERDGDWGELSHLIALSVAIRIPIYVFNRHRVPPRWETVPTELKPNCDPVQVKLCIDMYLYIIYRCIYLYIM